LKKHKLFLVHRYMLPGKSMEEADAEALRDAVAFREGLVDQGKIKGNSQQRNIGSGVTGVTWHRYGHWRSGHWRVQIRICDKNLERSFRPKDSTPEEIEVARLAAVAFREDLEHELATFRAKGPIKRSGWMLTQEGITRLTETGAAPGTQVFEGFGQLPATRRKRGCEEQLASGSAAEQGLPQQGRREDSSVPSSGSGSSTSQGADVGGLQVSAASRCASGGRDASGQGMGVQERVISVLSEQTGVPGKSGQEAEAEALHDAAASLEGLVQQGNIKVSTAKRTACIKGVNWDKSHGRWKVVYHAAGERKAGGSFKPKDDTAEEIERALLAAVECRRRLELEHGNIRVQGVTWDKYLGEWRVSTQVKGKHIHERFTPKDETPEEVERARRAAVERRRQLQCGSG